VSPVVAVLVYGEDSTEYEDAYRAGSHVRSTVVSCGFITVKLVTAFGTGVGYGMVLIGADVVGEPLPFTFDGVIVNVYSVSADKE
jgi:hypothetical protein